MSFDQHSSDIKGSSFHQSPYKYSKAIGARDYQSDPFNLIVIEDLMHGVNEWRNIQDVIRMALKALTDTVKLQGQSIQQIDQSLGSKASRNEVSQLLLHKANTVDINRSIADLTMTLDQKISYEDCKNMIREESSFQEQVTHTQIIKQLDEFQVSQQNNLQREIQHIQQQILTKANNADMMEQLDQKASKQLLTNSLSKKADKIYIEAKLNSKAENQEVNQILNVLEGKADYSQVEKVINLLDLKSDKQDIEHQNLKIKTLQEEIQSRQKDNNQFNDQLQGQLDEFKFQLTNKADIKDLDNFYQTQKVDQNNKINVLQSEIQNKINDIKYDFDNYQQQMENMIEEKDKDNTNLYEILRVDVNNVSETLKNQSQNMRQELDDNIQMVRQIANSVKSDIIRETQILGDNLNQFKSEYALNQIDKKEYEQFREQLDSKLDEKVDLEEVQGALNACQKDISNRFVQHRDQTKKRLEDQELQFLDLLKQKVTIQDMHDMLREKADIKVVESSLLTKASNQEMGEMKQQLEDIYNQLNEKLDVTEYQSSFSNCLNDIKDIRIEIAKKADMQHFGQMLTEKADLQDIQTYMRDIQIDLDRRALIDTVNRMNRDQAIINESLCTENIVGRWMWKSGQLKTGSLVPWEIQIVNTLPDNFLWEKDKSNILVCAPGLYEVLIGFYSVKKPSVQIQVNGEPIISAVNRLDSAKYKDHKHSLGQLTGLNVREVVILPQRSRISVVFNGDHTGEGFVSIKRL